MAVTSSFNKPVGVKVIPYDPNKINNQRSQGANGSSASTANPSGLGNNVGNDFSSSFNLSNLNPVGIVKGIGSLVSNTIDNTNSTSSMKAPIGYTPPPQQLNLSSPNTNISPVTVNSPKPIAPDLSIKPLGYLAGGGASTTPNVSSNTNVSTPSPSSNVTRNTINGKDTLSGPGFSISQDEGALNSMNKNIPSGFNKSTPESLGLLSKTLERNADPAFQARMAEQAAIVQDRYDRANTSSSSNSNNSSPLEDQLRGQINDQLSQPFVNHNSVANLTKQLGDLIQSRTAQGVSSSNNTAEMMKAGAANALGQQRLGYDMANSSIQNAQTELKNQNQVAQNLGGMFAKLKENNVDLPAKERYALARTSNPSFQLTPDTLPLILNEKELADFNAVPVEQRASYIQQFLGQ